MSLTGLFIFSLFIISFIGALWRPMIGILGYLVVNMFYNPKIWWGRAFRQYLPRPSFIATVFIVIGSLLHLRGLNWSFSRREIEYYIFLGLVWLSSLVFGLGMEAKNWFYLFNMTKMFVFIFLFIRIVDSLDNYKLVIWVFIFGAIFLAYQSHIVTSDFFSQGRLDFLGGFDFGEANSLAAFLSFGMILLGIEILRISWWKKIISIFFIALMFNTIIMTQSRGVFLGLLMTFPYILFRAPSESRKQIYILMILGIVLFCMLVNVKFIDRLKTASIELQINDQEARSRLDIWKASIRIFSDYPFGIGIKNFESLLPYYDSKLSPDSDLRGVGLDAHNTYILCYSEIGIQGIILFLIIILEAILQLRRIRFMVMNTTLAKDVNLYVFALGTAFIIYLTGYMMTHSNLYTETIWILLSLPVCLENATRKSLSQLGIKEII